VARLFLALWLPPEVTSAIEELPRKPRPRMRWVPPDQWHVTLRFLGEADPDDVGAALDDVALPRPDVRLGPGTDVLGDHSLVLPAAGVDELAAVIHRATRDVGGRPSRRRFDGHVTLARLRRRARLDGLVGRRLDAGFAADEVALVESRLRPEGAVYRTMRTWATGPT
jgi:2'-5' RNA ligase